MIPVDYRLIGGALMKPLRSAIRSAVRVVTGPLRASSPAAQARPEAAQPPASPAASPAVASATEDSQTLIVAHLAYLGYELGSESDGWSHACHPARYDFHLRTFACGTRLHCEVGIGASIGNSRAAWIEYLNHANDRGHLTRFSLVEYSNGICRVRMRALVSGGYNRKVFATVMDMWHDDLDLIRRKPEFPVESSDERAAAATVTAN